MAALVRTIIKNNPAHNVCVEALLPHLKVWVICTVAYNTEKNQKEAY